MPTSRIEKLDEREREILNKLNLPENIKGVSFNKLYDKLHGKMSRDSFSRRLFALEEMGLITRAAVKNRTMIKSMVSGVEKDINEWHKANMELLDLFEDTVKSKNF